MGLRLRKSIVETKKVTALLLFVIVFSQRKAQAARTNDEFVVYDRPHSASKVRESTDLLRHFSVQAKDDENFLGCSHFQIKE